MNAFVQVSANVLCSAASSTATAKTSILICSVLSFRPSLHAYKLISAENNYSFDPSL